MILSGPAGLSVHALADVEAPETLFVGCTGEVNSLVRFENCRNTAAFHICVFKNVAVFLKGHLFTQSQEIRILQHHIINENDIFRQAVYLNAPSS